MNIRHIQHINHSIKENLDRECETTNGKGLKVMTQFDEEEIKLYSVVSDGSKKEGATLPYHVIDRFGSLDIKSVWFK